MKPSASKLELARACSYPWSHLAPPWPPYKPSAAGDKGTEVHKLAEDIAGELPHDASHPYAAAIKGALTELGPGVVEREVALAYSIDTGKARRLRTDGHRGYPSTHHHELMGTVDLIHIADELHIHVGDWKTGVMARKHKASESMQLRFLGLAAARLYGVDSVRISLIHLEPGGEYEIDDHQLEAWDLDAIHNELRVIFMDLESENPVPRPGPHCKDGWCPIMAQCPATRAAITRAEESMRVRLPVLGDLTTDEQAASWRQGLKHLEEFTKDVKSKLAEYVRVNGAVEIAPGLWFGIQETEKENVDLSVPGAAELVASVVGDAAIERTVSTTKTAIEAAAKASQSKRGEGVKTARSLYDSLRAMGAMKKSVYDSPREFSRSTGEDQ